MGRRRSAMSWSQENCLINGFCLTCERQERDRAAMAVCVDLISSSFPLRRRAFFLHFLSPRFSSGAVVMIRFRLYRGSRNHLLNRRVLFEIITYYHTFFSSSSWSPRRGLRGFPPFVVRFSLWFQLHREALLIHFFSFHLGWSLCGRFPAVRTPGTPLLFQMRALAGRENLRAPVPGGFFVGSCGHFS